MKNYNAQNSKQMKIFAFEEVFFFLRTTRNGWYRDYTTFLPG